MITQKKTTCILAALTLVTLGGLTHADVFTWILNADDVWDNDLAWSGTPDQFPVSGDDAIHDNVNIDQRIAVRRSGGETCATFEGDGSDPGERFLLIEDQISLTVEDSIFSSGNDPFQIMFQDGNSTTSTGLIVGSGGMDNLSLEMSNEGGPWNGEYVLVDVEGAMDDSIITFPGDNNALNVGGNVTDSTIEFTGDDNVIEIDGDVTGTDVELAGTGTTLDALGDITSGTWILAGSAVLTADQTGTTVTGGDRSLDDTAEAHVQDVSGGT